MRTSPIAIGWCRRRHGTHARDEDREQGQGEALVLRRANRKDERLKPEQHKCDVEALHPLQRHTAQVRHFIDRVAGSLLVSCPPPGTAGPVLGSQRLRVRFINHLEGIAVRQSDSDANLFITGIKRHSFKTGFVKMRKHAVSLKSESEDCGHVRISIPPLPPWAKDFRVRRRRLLRCDTDTCTALIYRVPIVLHACIDRMHRPTVCTVRRITE